MCQLLWGKFIEIHPIVVFWVGTLTISSRKAVVLAFVWILGQWHSKEFQGIML